MPSALKLPLRRLTRKMKTNGDRSWVSVEDIHLADHQLDAGSWRSLDAACDIFSPNLSGSYFHGRPGGDPEQVSYLFNSGATHIV
jgi:hypothetical protein